MNDNGKSGRRPEESTSAWRDGPCNVCAAPDGCLQFGESTACRWTPSQRIRHTASGTFYVHGPEAPPLPQQLPSQAPAAMKPGRTKPQGSPVAGASSDGHRGGNGRARSGDQNAANESEARPRAVVRKLADVLPERLEWLWPGRIPLGKLTLLAGDPGLGKSFLTLDMAGFIQALAESSQKMRKGFC